MGFEVLSDNLLDFIKLYNYRGLPMAFVKKISREMLLGLDYLHSECHIIHTDLKPENVLISLTKPINVSKLNREKNRELKKQYERQLNRFESQIEDKHNKLSKNQRKKLRQKINELKKNVSNVDKEYIVLLRDNANSNQVNDEKKDAIQPQFEYIHGRSIKDEHHQMIDCKAPIAKICDLGNACWTNKHFTDDITTRQYRSPEAILQCGYDTKTDIWSLGCIIFELITGDYLFDPREKEEDKDNYGYCRDTDHLALIGELCGKPIKSPWPLRWTLANDKRFGIKGDGGNFDEKLKLIRKSIKRPGLVRDFFGGYKKLKRDDMDIRWDFTLRGDQLSDIQKLDHWSLAAVLEDKYKIPHQKKAEIEYEDAESGHDEAIDNSLADFLGKMLIIDPINRCSAKQMLEHKWLQITKKDIEECYKAECRWYESNGKPPTDTNANYGLTAYDLYKMNEENANEEDDDDEDDDESEEESAESITSSHRSRSSSVDARDQFANKRAMSEPPVTWHKYLGIKWYEQFEDILDSKEEYGMNGMDHNDDNEESDDDDLYEMDPEFDPHENKLVESYEEYEDDSSDSEQDETLKKPFNGLKHRVSLEIAEDQNDENEDYEEFDEENENEHQTQSSLIIHGDETKDFLEQIGVNENEYDAEADDEDDEEKEQDNDLSDILQKLSLNSSTNGNLTKLNEQNDNASDMELDNDEMDEIDDKIASLPIFSNNGNRDLRNSISTNSSHGAHSRTSSSTSTFDID